MTRDEALEKIAELPMDGDPKTVGLIIDMLCFFDLVRLDPPKSDITFRVTDEDRDEVCKALAARNIHPHKIAIVDQSRNGGRE